MNHHKPEFCVITQRNGDGYYVGEVPQLRACYSQARTIDELMAKMVPELHSSKKRDSHDDYQGVSV